MERDTHRSRVYRAETILGRMLDRCDSSGNPVVQIHGITVTMPPEAKFGSLESVSTYVDRVLAMPSVIERFGVARRVTVRERKGAREAHYEPDGAVIAVPVSASETRWAMRELVVLHELAHHLCPDSGHGPRYTQTLLSLLELVMGAEVALVLRVLYGQNGAPTAP